MQNNHLHWFFKELSSLRSCQHSLYWVLLLSLNEWKSSQLWTTWGDWSHCVPLGAEDVVWESRAYSWENRLILLCDRRLGNKRECISTYYLKVYLPSLLWDMGWLCVPGLWLMEQSIISHHIWEINNFGICIKIIKWAGFLWECSLSLESHFH